jgi:mutator protein MutT
LFSRGCEVNLKRVAVAIGIVARGGRVLVCQRREDPGDAFGGMWEFPGGKCEPGETPEACVRRELREELGIEVAPTAALAVIEHRYPSVHVQLHPFVCRLESGEPTAISAAEARWVDRGELGGYRFPEANASLLRELAGIDLGSDGA